MEFLCLNAIFLWVSHPMHLFWMLFVWTCCFLTTLWFHYKDRNMNNNNNNEQTVYQIFTTEPNQSRTFFDMLSFYWNTKPTWKHLEANNSQQHLLLLKIGNVIIKIMHCFLRRKKTVKIHREMLITIWIMT